MVPGRAFLAQREWTKKCTWFWGWRCLAEWGNQCLGTEMQFVTPIPQGIATSFHPHNYCLVQTIGNSSAFSPAQQLPE